MDRKKLLYFLLILIPIGISMKLYTGPGDEWVAGSLCGLVFVLFFCLLLRLLLDKPKNFSLSFGVFIAVCILEFLQLWKPPFLEAVRGTLPGQTLLGSTFSWNDFPYYFLGAWLGQRVLNKISALP